MSHGKICYLEIPASDVEGSARFYADVFGWTIRTRGDGQRAFDDSAGAISGSWVAGSRPASEPGVVVYVMVDSIPATLEEVRAAGGRVSTPMTVLGASGEAYATILAPAGLSSASVRSPGARGRCLVPARGPNEFFVLKTRATRGGGRR